LPYYELVLFECDKVAYNSECDRGLDTSTKALDKYISSGYEALYPVIMKVGERGDEVLVTIIEPP
jgi:regulator of sigma D